MPPSRPGILAPFVVIGLVVAAATVYANVPRYWIVMPDDFRYFPPFEPYQNKSFQQHLGGEYRYIAEALRAGRGFADPFREETGPTAWMPPALPAVQAVFLWLADDDEIRVTNIVVVCQAIALIAVGGLALLANQRSAVRPRPWLLTGLYALFLAANFNAAFQITHDPWFLMLGQTALLLLHAKLPDRATPVSIGAWGIGGGLAALSSPVLGFVWGVLTVTRWPRWRPVGVCVLVAGLTLSPWVVRNYRVFGTVIPVKSNLFYELYQSQCITPDGLIHNSTWPTHPYHAGPERDDYATFGEQEYLARKKALFLAALRADPGDFAVRVWNRLTAATMVYVPTDRQEEEAPDEVWNSLPRYSHPLPFLAVVVLLISPRRLHRHELTALIVYVAWLFPYVAASYYPRYGFPLVGVKVFLCLAALDRLLPRPTAGAPLPGESG